MKLKNLGPHVLQIFMQLCILLETQTLVQK
jgi:hypothetical protein